MVAIISLKVLSNNYIQKYNLYKLSYLAVYKDIFNSSDIKKFNYLYIIMKIGHCQNERVDMSLYPGMLEDDKIGFSGEGG